MMNEHADVAERFGYFCGTLLAPVTAATSGARHARTFHPDGVVYDAQVKSTAQRPDLHELATRLGSSAMMRLSSALWRAEHEWPDVLGAAIRFGTGATTQDLLLATIRFPWTMPFAPLATNFRSFLWNHYHAVSPFEVDGVGRVKLRLRSPRLGNSTSASRLEHLQAAARAGHAVYDLQVRRLSAPAMARFWEPVARLTLQQPLELDQEHLRFSPFRAGAGVRPRGFVHSLRFAAYAASQHARPEHA